MTACAVAVAAEVAALVSLVDAAVALASASVSEAAAAVAAASAEPALAAASAASVVAMVACACARAAASWATWDAVLTWSLSIPVSRSEEHTSELQSLMRISYAVFCLKKKKRHIKRTPQHSNK